MPRDILVEPTAGQRVIVNPVGGLTVKASVGKTKLTATVTVAGTYVEPPPVTPPPVTPPPVVPPVTPPVTPPSGTTVAVTSIAAARTAMLDNAVGEIVFRNGSYNPGPGVRNGGTNQWWVGPEVAFRTRPLLIRAETPGGVTFRGTTSNRWFVFTDGSHDLAFDGFVFDGLSIGQDGIVKIGGDPDYIPSHHITWTRTTVLPSCRGTGQAGSLYDHVYYVAHAKGDGPHDILIDGVTADLTGGLDSVFHAYHSDGGPMAHHVTVRAVRSSGGMTPIVVDDASCHDYTVTDTEVRGFSKAAVRYLGGAGSHDNRITVRYQGPAALDSQTNSVGAVLDVKPL